MGWLIDEDDKHEHEGYVIGLVQVPDSGSFRELTFLTDGKAQTAIPLQYVCIGCECGWRSSRLLAPAGTEWSPCSVWLAYGMSDETVEGYEESARKMWRAHVDDIAKSGKPRLRVDEDGFRRAWRRRAAEQAKRSGKSAGPRRMP